MANATPDTAPPYEEVISLILALLQEFLGNSPLVEDIVIVLPQIVEALSSAKAGSPFTVTFPLPLDGDKGDLTISWKPAT